MGEKPVFRFVSAHRSALILACEKGSSEVAELLLSHGADAGAVDSMGPDALHYALCTQDKALWRLLRQALNRRRQGGKSTYFICMYEIRKCNRGGELDPSTLYTCMQIAQ
jgi:ankyrin repeat protein